MLLKKRLNVRLFLLLMGGFIVLAPSVHFLHAYQVQRTAGLLLHQAEAAQEDGDLGKAIGYLSRYIALEPTDAKARGDFALLLADDKIAVKPRALWRAYYALQDALRLNGDRQDVRRRAIKLAMNSPIIRFNDAAMDIDKLFEQNVKDAELWGWRGLCYEVLNGGDFKEARKSYEEALRQPTKDPENYIRLAFLLISHWDKVKLAKQTKEEVFQAADQKVEEMLAAFPKSYKACLMSANYYLSKPADAADNAEKRAGRNTRVSQDIAKALDLAPNEVDVLLFAAEVEMEKQRAAASGTLLESVPETGANVPPIPEKMPEPRVLLERGIKLHPEDWRFYMLLSRLEMDKKQPEAAVGALKRGLATLPTQLNLLWDLANLQLQQGQNEEAGTNISLLEKEKFPALELEYLKGRLLVNKKLWSKAARDLERTYPQLLSQHNKYKDLMGFNLTQECNSLLAQCYEAMGDPYRAAAIYGQILTRAPASIPGRLGLARMEWASGRLDFAWREYQFLMQNRPAPIAAWLECAHMLIQRNSKLTNPNWLEATQVLDVAVAKFKDVPAAVTMEIAILRAEILAAEGKFDQARELLAKEYQDAKKRPVEVWVGSAALEELAKRKDLVLDILNDAERNLGDRAELRVARIKYWAGQGGDKALRALGKLGTDVEKWPEADQRRLADALAQAYLRLGETKLAAQAWRTIAARQDSDVGSRLALFELALQAGEDASMRGLVAELKIIEGDEGTLWRFCQAQRLMRQAEKQKDNKALLTEAQNLLTKVRERRTNWSRVPVAEAQINELLPNRQELAIAKYREALAMGDQNVAVIHRLMSLLVEKKRIEEVADLLEQLRERKATASLTQLSGFEAVVAIGRNEPEVALENIEKGCFCPFPRTTWTATCGADGCWKRPASRTKPRPLCARPSS